MSQSKWAEKWDGCNNNDKKKMRRMTVMRVAGTNTRLWNEMKFYESVWHNLPPVNLDTRTKESVNYSEVFPIFDLHHLMVNNKVGDRKSRYYWNYVCICVAWNSAAWHPMAQNVWYTSEHRTRIHPIESCMENFDRFRLVQSFNWIYSIHLVLSRVSSHFSTMLIHGISGYDLFACLTTT